MQNDNIHKMAILYVYFSHKIKKTVFFSKSDNKIQNFQNLKSNVYWRAL